MIIGEIYNYSVFFSMEIPALMRYTFAVGNDIENLRF